MRGDGRASRRWTAALLVVLLGSSTMLVAAAGSAGASIFHREQYAGTDEFTYDICGFVVEVDVTFSGRLLIREGKHGNDSAYFAHDKFQYTETHSANGKFFTISGNVLFQETRAVPLGDDLFAFDSVEAGQPFVVRGMDGEVLLRDRGAIRRTLVFDTLGDETPGGIFVDQLDLHIAGPHPGFFIDPMEACPLLAPDPT